MRSAVALIFGEWTSAMDWSRLHDIVSLETDRWAEQDCFPFWFIAIYCIFKSQYYFIFDLKKSQDLVHTENRVIEVIISVQVGSWHQEGGHHRSLSWCVVGNEGIIMLRNNY